MRVFAEPNIDAAGWPEGVVPICFPIASVVVGRARAADPARLGIVETD